MPAGSPRIDRGPQVAALAAAGLTRQQAAQAIGVGYARLVQIARANAIEFVNAAAFRPGREARIEKMAAMYRQGLTLEKIGQHFGLTRERVRQIIRKAGVTSVEGGASKQAAHKLAAAQSRREAKALARWGVSHAEMKLRRADGTLRAYIFQEKSARNRGIEWALSFPQWLSVWIASGKLSERGRGKGRYVMSRIKDEGGYKVGNVHVQLSTDNNSQGIAKCRKNKAANAGVWRLYPGASKPWVAKAGKKYLGMFSTEAEAAAARVRYLVDNPFCRTRRGRGYTVFKGKNGDRFQVMVGRKYIGSFGTPAEALAARAAYLASQLADLALAA